MPNKIKKILFILMVVLLLLLILYLNPTISTSVLILSGAVACAIILIKYK